MKMIDHRAASREAARGGVRRAISRRIPTAVLAALALCTGANADPLADLPLERNILSSPILGPVPYGFASWRDLFAEQERLNDAAQLILAEPNARDQLAGVIASPGARRLQVYWKGGLKDSTQALLAQIRTNVPVEMHAAEHSRAELIAAGRRLLALDEVNGFGPRSDGSGLDIQLDPSMATAGSAEAVLARVSRVVPGMHVTAAMNSPARFAHSRDAMTLPAYAGGRIRDERLSNICSLGFPVTRTVAGIRQDGWLTAAHCTHEDGNSRIFAGSIELGSVVARNKFLDASFIRTSSRDNLTSRVYVGRPAGHSAAVPISRSRANVAGNVVYSSGSSTGLNGPLVVEALDDEVENKEYWVCGANRSCVKVEGFTVKPLVRAKHLYNQAATGNGDSGGAIISFHTDGTAIARGVMTQKRAPVVTCPADHVMPIVAGNDCTSIVLFADIDGIRKNFDVGVIATDWPR